MAGNKKKLIDTTTTTFLFFTGPALIAVFFLKTEAAILHKYV